MGTMKAVIKTAQNEFELREVPIPEPGPGEALVKMTLGTICGTDVHLLEFPMFPGMETQSLGHEATGIVAKLGPGVTRFHQGDRVVMSCVSTCGTCASCQRGDLSACTGRVSMGITGMQAEYFIVPYADVNLARIPDELKDEQVLFVSDIMSTGFGAVERGGIKAGDSVAVFAQGPVGLCATAGARAFGAGMVIGVESVPERIAMAKRMGANFVVNPKETDPYVEIMRLTDNMGVDIAVEAVGTEATFQAAVLVTKLGGSMVSFGTYGLLPFLSLPLGPTFFHKKISFLLCPPGTDRLVRLMDMVRYGNVDLTPLWTHRMKLEGIKRAYEMFRNREGGVLKIAITP